MDAVVGEEGAMSEILGRPARTADFIIAREPFLRSWEETLSRVCCRS